MRRLRAQLTRLGPVIAALFALSIAAPRAALLYHTHPGGEHAHVHAEDDIAVELLAELGGHHHHHPHESGAHHHSAVAATHHGEPSSPQSGPSLRRDDGAATGHWHQQDQYQRGLAIAVALIADSAPARRLAHALPRAGTRTSARDLRVRGPPSSPPA